jgi:AmiR/NasT family two-component response regulator
MSSDPTGQLRVLIANERPDRLERVAQIVAELGHEVIARQLEVSEVGLVTREERPDVALVGLGASSEHALELIKSIVHEAACPVITLLEARDSAFVHEAAKRGVFAYITDTDPEQLAGAIDIVLRRFAEFHNLEGAFGRRAVIEQAKGIRAFELLRTHSQHNGRKLATVAEAIVESHLLLLPSPPAQASASGDRADGKASGVVTA